MEFSCTRFAGEQKINTEDFHQFRIGNYFISVSNHNCKKIQLPKATILILGDCINSQELCNNDLITPVILRKLKGIFILIAIEEDSFKIYPSLFSMLPIYYSSDFKTISNSLELIKKTERFPTQINRRFILESYLFNYPFSDQTYLKSIKRLDSFSSLIFRNGEIQVEKDDNISDWFTDNPISGKKELEYLAEVFLEQIKQYYAPYRNSVTFTGGFDGRTIVAAGLLHKTAIETFSMGRPENDDVNIPLGNAKKLGIPYHYYDLGASDFQESYPEWAKKMSILTGGFNGFLYAHFLYGAAKESAKNHYLLTGYCGSELFRALNVQGAITSADLVSVFNHTDDIALKNLLWNSEKLAFLEKEKYENAFEEMFEEILAYRKSRPTHFLQNHFFYQYVFTEVFRKVFGSWTLAQFDFINIRIPFLDYTFVRKLLLTEFAGCNNEFFIHNPFKRLKGQLLYAEIIKQSSPELFQLYTGKGYRPSDLMSFYGKCHITIPFIKKRISRKTNEPFLDNLGLVSGYKLHRKTIEDSFQKLEGFNHNALLKASSKLNGFTPEKLRDMIFQSASLATLI